MRSPPGFAPCFRAFEGREIPTAMSAAASGEPLDLPVEGLRL